MIDQFIVGIYLLLTLSIGLLVGKNIISIREFAIGKRNFSNIVLISTLFATVISSGSTVILARQIFTDGLIYWLSYMGVVFGYLGIALFIAPNFQPFLGLLSSGDVLGKIYGRKAKIFMGFATIFESVMLIGMQLLAVTHLCEYFFGISKNISAFGILIVIIFYTFRGGIRSVSATDVFQFIMLIIAIPVMSAIAFIKIGGFENIFLTIKSPPKQFIDPDYLRHSVIFISFALPAIFPRTMQRMLMAKNTEQIKKIFIANSVICIFFYICVCIIGIASWTLVPNIEPNFVFSALINEILPIGFKGFVVAGLLAVFMSSIDSDLNLASIAIAHDIAAPLSKKTLSEETKLKIARYSSIMTAIIAVGTGLYFGSLIQMLYFILCISNSAFFPGYLLGLLGLRPGPKGFWTGLIAATVSVFFFTFAVGLFELYTGLISILINIFILIFFHIKEKNSLDYLPVRKISNQAVRSFQEPIINNVFYNSEYFNIFAVLSVIHGIGTFFVIPAYGRIDYSFYLAMYLISAIISLLIILREIWWNRIQKLFIPILNISITLSLPCLTFLMCLYSGFDKIWLIDLIIVFIILVIFMSKRNLLLISFSGIISALFIYFLSNAPSIEQVLAIANWSFLAHVIILISCLYLFRKQDIERYHYLTGKLAHEASRSLVSLSNSAQFLKNQLPSLINFYEQAKERDLALPYSLDKEVLHELKELPKRLEQMGQRTSETLEALLSKTHRGSKQKLALIDIFSCVIEALADPSIKKEDKNKIRLKLDYTFSFFGNQSQISQVILNIIENALYALKSKEDGYIDIWAEGKSLFIKDNGIGISSQDFPNIFDEFYSTKKTMGLGLAFSNQIMGEHKGLINCISEENQYSQFELKFLEGA